MSKMTKVVCFIIFFLIALVMNYSTFSISNADWYTNNKCYLGLDGFDSCFYVQYVNYFLGSESVLPPAPFSYRLLTSFMASYLPFSPRVSINILNFFGLYFSSIIIFLLAKKYFSQRVSCICALLFLISWPSFHYCTNTYVDSLAVFFLTLLLYCTLNNKLIYFIFYNRTYGKRIRSHSISSIFLFLLR